MLAALRRFTHAAVFAAAFISLSCSIDMPAPQEQQEPSALLGSTIESLVSTVEEVIETPGGLPTATLSRVKGLLSCPTSGYATVTQTVGYAGGTIVVGPHRLEIPRGALLRDTKITASAPAGEHIRVDFQPAGLRFERLTALTLSYAECGVLASTLPKKVVYVDGRSLDILYVLPSADRLLRREVTGRLNHFSTYAVAD